MARITVEDCLKKLNNRFDLVLVCSKRAREIATGGKEPYLEWENDKPTVVALREVAEGYVDRSILSKKTPKAVPLPDLAGASLVPEIPQEPAQTPPAPPEEAQ